MDRSLIHQREFSTRTPDSQRPLIRSLWLKQATHAAPTLCDPNNAGQHVCSWQSSFCLWNRTAFTHSPSCAPGWINGKSKRSDNRRFILHTISRRASQLMFKDLLQPWIKCLKTHGVVVILHLCLTWVVWIYVCRTLAPPHFSSLLRPLSGAGVSRNSPALSCDS